MKKSFKRGILAVVLILVAVYFFPRPLIRNPERCTVTSILYRDSDWDTVRYFYPTTDGSPHFNMDEFLQLLHRSKSVPKLVPYLLTGVVPNDVVTLWIFITDGDSTKNIILGDWNVVRTQGSVKQSRILNADSVLSEALEILGIDENTDFSALVPIA
jgi:hypothetical protein